MEKKYISVDVETSGRTPGKYSMLSLGACVVGDTSKQFYRELKPISSRYDIHAMRVSCQGLHCLKPLKRLPRYNPNHSRFSPEAVLDVLCDEGKTPSKVMTDFAQWILDVTQGYKPVELAAPIKFDGMFTAWYFDNFFNRKNPFGHSGEDLGSLYRGGVSDRNARIEELGFRKQDLPHNALEDAIIQAQEAEIVLANMI
jgi:ribonuclease T